jgi:choline-sulfatase
MYPIDEVPPPEIGLADDHHSAVAAMRSFFDYGRWFDPELTQRGRQAYFALVSWLDHNVGRALGALEAAGELDNTLVIYTSDHGEMAGNRGLWCKSFMYRDSVDVPMIMAGPGVPPGATCDTEVSLVDIAATLDEAAGRTTDAHASLRMIASRPTDTDRLGFSEYHDGGSITGSFAVRRRQWKYIEHVDHPPQLFDVDADPDELVDLGPSSAHRSVRTTLAAAMREIVDPQHANDLAFASQERLMEVHGGRDGVARAFRFNHTPIPGDESS